MPTPTGTPAWRRTNDHTAYGGHVNKTNYEGVSTVNPRTDLSAENLARIAADMAAVARTAPFAVMRFTCDDTTPANPTINDYSAMAGSSPTPLRNGNGDVQFTWSDSYSDPYSIAADIHIIAAEVTVNGSTSRFPVAELSDSTANGKNDRVRIRVFDDAGVAATNQVVTLTIYTG